MTAARRLIVNADDFGLTAGVNEAVERAHTQGVLTSTTVLVNQGAAEAAGEFSRRHPQLGFGLHVNLTLGEPVSAPESVRTLVDSEGRFLGNSELVKRALKRRVDGGEIHREVTAQLERLRSFGVEPTHWDTHEAAAFWPWLVRPAADAAAAGGITRCRSPRVWIASDRPGAARFRWTLASRRRLATQPARAISRGLLRRRGFAMPEWRLSPNLVDRGEAPYEERWHRSFELLPPGTAEMVTHPAVVDAELERITPRLTAARKTDLEVLCDPAIAGMLRERDVELVSFSRL